MRTEYFDERVATVYESVAELDAAVKRLQPLPRDVTLLLIHASLKEPSLLAPGDKAMESVLGAAMTVFRVKGFDPLADRGNYQQFMVWCCDHASAMLDMARSAVRLGQEEDKKRAAWGVAGKVAAVALGAALGAWLG